MFTYCNFVIFIKYIVFQNIKTVYKTGFNISENKFCFYVQHNNTKNIIVLKYKIVKYINNVTRIKEKIMSKYCGLVNLYFIHKIS